MQTASPTSDVNAASYTTSPLWSKVDEATASDSDYITSDPLRVGSDSCILKLGSVTDPTVNSSHTLYVRAWRSPGIFLVPDFTFSLRQGTSTVLATKTIPGTTITTAATTFALALTEVEASAITNYANLHVGLNDFSAVYELNVSWIQLQVPNAPSNTAIIVDGDAVSDEGGGGMSTGRPVYGETELFDRMAYQKGHQDQKEFIVISSDQLAWDDTLLYMGEPQSLQDLTDGGVCEILGVHYPSSYLKTTRDGRRINKDIPID